MLMDILLNCGRPVPIRIRELALSNGLQQRITVGRKGNRRATDLCHGALIVENCIKGKIRHEDLKQRGAKAELRDASPCQEIYPGSKRALEPWNKEWATLFL